MRSVTLFGLSLVIFTSASYGGELPKDFEQKLDHYFSDSLTKKRFVGASVAVVTREGTEVIRNYGYQNLEAKVSADSNTIYELGSITKTFTKLLLATEKDILLSDAISKYLPSEIHSPLILGSEIRIQDLILHTGFRFGVPCFPDLADFGDVKKWKCFGMTFDPEMTDPYNGVSREKLFQYVNQYQTMVDANPKFFIRPGLFYEYSNAGMGLLGEVLSLKNSTSYANLLEQKILDPLEMRHTFVEMPCDRTESCENLARVYRLSKNEETWERATLWHLPGMPGAGAARSSIVDMTLYLKAHLGLRNNRTAEFGFNDNKLVDLELSNKKMSDRKLNHELNDAISKSQSEVAGAEELLKSILCAQNEKDALKPCNRNVAPQYYGWPTDADRKVFYHAGATGASQSSIIFSRDHSLGVVVLTNSAPGPKGAEAKHFANTASVCLFQLAGKPIAPRDVCSDF